jgi:CubicO group peptidase (beta-lactamase class C family)
MGFIVMSKILEKISGLSLDELFKREAAGPLGLKDSGYLPPAGRDGGYAATEYAMESGKMLSGVVHDFNARFLNGIADNARIFSTLADMTIWTRMLLRKGRIKDGALFLSEDTITKFNTNLTPGLEENWGIGFKMWKASEFGAAPEDKDYFIYGHTGYTGTAVIVDPVRRIGFVLLANRIHPKVDDRLLDERPRVYRRMFAALDKSCGK